MAAHPVEKKSRLHHILVVEAGVAENIAKWITDDEEGPQCESPADFAKLWSTATMATGPKVDVLDRMDPVISTDTFKGRKIAGRLQAAWDFCSQDLAGKARQLAAPPIPLYGEKYGVFAGGEAVKFAVRLGAAKWPLSGATAAPA